MTTRIGLPVSLPVLLQVRVSFLRLRVQVRVSLSSALPPPSFWTWVSGSGSRWVRLACRLRERCAKLNCAGSGAGRGPGSGRHAVACPSGPWNLESESLCAHSQEFLYPGGPGVRDSSLSGIPDSPMGLGQPTAVYPNRIHVRGKFYFDFVKTLL